MPRDRKIFVDVGRRFHRLVVFGDIVKSGVLVKCDCGTEKRVNVYALLNGRVKSCGCFNVELVRKRAAAKPTMAKRSIGNVFGRLTVLGITAGRRHFVDCRCECGNTTSVYAYSLYDGDTKSCGCLNREMSAKRNSVPRGHMDLTGQRFGRLRVLSLDHITKSKTAWKCICDCGASKVISAHALRGNLTRSCGCLQKECVKRTMTKHGRYKDKDYLSENSSKRRALKRGAFVEVVNPAIVYERDMGLCQICGLPVEGKHFSLDHGVPLARGGEHSYANCRTAHISCNSSKRTKLPEECDHLWMRS